MDWEFKELGFSYDALEPFIDGKTMEVHHTKHYKAYFDKALAAIGDKKNRSVEEILLTDLSDAVQNNGGGFFNHTMFWDILGKNNGKGPVGNVHKKMVASFQSVENFKEQFTNQALTLFGSGWVFVVYDEVSDELEIIRRKNQDHPLCGKKVLFGLDVWEHAYYLKYQNRRPEYVEAFWQVLDWEKVENRFLQEKVFVLG